MHNVKWYTSDGIYEANGGSSANSLFFETKTDNILFLELWDRFVGDYANLIHYSLTEISWSIIFKTKDFATIQKVYNDKHQRSKKVKLESKLEEIGPILSQAMRLFLSNYVAMSNRSLGKDGSRVKRRFTKYGFNSVEDYRDRIEVLDRMEKLHEQFKQKYRPDDSYYDENMEMGLRCVNRSSAPFYKGLKRGHCCVRGFFRMEYSTTVLRSIFETNSPTPKTPKIPPES